MSIFFFSIRFECLDSKQILVFECHISMVASLIMHNFFFLLAEPICIGFRMWKSYSNSLNATTMKNFYKFLLVCLDNLFLLKTENTIAVGPKNLVTPAHFILSPRPTPKRKKCPRTNEEGSNCQETLPRTILFSANQDHRRRKQHATKVSLPEIGRAHV